MFIATFIKGLLIYRGVACLKDSSSDDISVKRLLIDNGILRRMLGGWLVGLTMDVEWDVVGLRVWLVLSG